MPPKKTTKEPVVSSTSTTNTRKNLLGQNVKVTRTNTTSDYGNKVVATKRKDKEVSVSPKRTVVKQNFPADNSSSLKAMKNKKADKLIAGSPKSSDGGYSATKAADKERVLRTRGKEKTTTYGERKKNIVGIGKPATIKSPTTRTAKSSTLRDERTGKVGKALTAAAAGGMVAGGIGTYRTNQKLKKQGYSW